MAKKTKSGNKNKQIVEEKKSIFSPSEIKKFVDEVKVEFTKIVWPDRKTTMSLTGVVIVFSILASAYLGSVDLLLGKLIDSVLR
ncbi:MAG: preprotein translocase subunit SecE [Desulfocapsa sp.]|nr:MAG: preprotein translocase subunit SecE [Desulfocapsa sp.]